MIFSACFVPGPDGIRPQHLLELVQSQEAGPGLFTAVTTFVNSLLDGNCHDDYQHILFGGKLIALDKKSSGIRPIVVGYVWRRLAAKGACTHATKVLSGYFSPRQVGIGVPGGYEAPVHAVRRFMEGMRGDYVVVKLDFSNTFNCLHRDFMLERVAEMVPELYRFCHLAYSNHSSLQFGELLVSSQVGSQ